MYKVNELFEGNWEQELDRQYLCNDKLKKRAYICSPLSDEHVSQQARNMKNARGYMLYVNKLLGYYARAPHAFLPALLCDKVAAERALALAFGLHLLELCDILLVCGTRISSGMKGEILHAAKLGIPIVVYDESVYLEVRKLVTRTGAPKSLVSLDERHPLLGSPDPLVGREWQVKCGA